MDIVRGSRLFEDLLHGQFAYLLSPVWPCPTPALSLSPCTDARLRLHLTTFPRGSPGSALGYAIPMTVDMRKDAAYTNCQYSKLPGKPAADVISLPSPAARTALE
jgi:hypothetical protein